MSDTNNNAAIEAALIAFRPAIAARYESLINRSFENLVNLYGASMSGIANTKAYSFWSKTIRPVCRSTGGEVVGGRQSPFIYQINAERLAKKAAEYAEAVTIDWLGKITLKLGELENAEVKHMTGVSFLISGTRDGARIQIEQQMILNQSPKGTLFNQFPARIYIDGKASSEAAYKKRFAA